MDTLYKLNTKVNKGFSCVFWLMTKGCPGMVNYLVCSLKNKLRSIKRKAEFIVIDQNVPRGTRAGMGLGLRFHHYLQFPHICSALISLPHLSPSSSLDYISVHQIENGW